MKPDWDWVATGPGIGIQLKHGPHAGRLVIPSDHKRPLPGKQLEWNSHMMFSDDGGESWRIGAPIQTGGNECQVIERTDGSLLVNTRMQGDWQGWRGIATSTDGGATWTAIAQEKQLPCPKCQGSLLCYDAGRLLFSNPQPPAPKDGQPSGARVNLTVRLSPDDGRTWPVARLLNAGPSAYSSLARLPDGTILCLYEGGEKRAYEALRLARFNLEWLTQPAPSTVPGSD
jgi:sialidase-1